MVRFTINIILVSMLIVTTIYARSAVAYAQNDAFSAIPISKDGDLSALLTPPNGDLQSEIVSPKPDGVAITIYRDDLALITETRSIEIPAGRSKISFAGVNDLIIPQTAILREFGAINIERNFDFNLLSQSSLFEKSVGQKVYLTRTNPSTGEAFEQEAIIISAGRGVVMDIEGEIEVFDCSGLPEKITFDDIPPELRAEPTLSLEVSAEEAGVQNFTISYLASGFDWEADYILTLGEEGKADIAGWLTLRNETAISIQNAPTGVIAGNLQRLGETRSEETRAKVFYASCWPRGSTRRGAAAPDRFSPISRSRKQSEGTQVEFAVASIAESQADLIQVTAQKVQAEREDIGDYKLYFTPQPTTVAAYQSKQVLFLQKPDIDVTRIHVFERNDGFGKKDYTDYNNAILRYDIDNNKEGGLAEPLPAGNVRVMSKINDEDLSTFYLGEGEIRDLAVGLPVEVGIGRSPSVNMETTIISSKRTGIGKNRYRYMVEIAHKITNANAYQVLTEISQNREGYLKNLKVSNSSRTRDKKSAYPKWQWEISAYSASELTYMLEWTD